MDDDIETAAANFAQKRRKTFGPRGRVPACLRQVLIEYSYVVTRECDELVDRNGLLAHRGDFDDARLLGIFSRVG